MADNALAKNRKRSRNDEGEITQETRWCAPDESEEEPLPACPETADEEEPVAVFSDEDEGTEQDAPQFPSAPPSPILVLDSDDEAMLAAGKPTSIAQKQ